MKSQDTVHSVKMQSGMNTLKTEDLVTSQDTSAEKWEILIDELASAGTQEITLKVRKHKSPTISLLYSLWSDLMMLLHVMICKYFIKNYFNLEPKYKSVRHDIPSHKAMETEKKKQQREKNSTNQLKKPFDIGQVSKVDFHRIGKKFAKVEKKDEEFEYGGTDFKTPTKSESVQVDVETPNTSESGKNFCKRLFFWFL